MCDNGDDSLEEGEIASPSASPSRASSNPDGIPPRFSRPERLARKRKRSTRARSQKCRHCGFEDRIRYVVDDFDRNCNNYFLRMRKKAMEKSIDFMARLPSLPSSVPAEDKKTTENHNDISDDDSDIDKLRDQALQSQRTPNSQDSEEELYELRAAALKTALIKKSSEIFNKKVNKGNKATLGSEAQTPPMKENSPAESGSSEGKENEALDIILLRKSLLEHLVVKRRKNSRLKAAAVNAPLSPNQNTLNKPSTSKVMEKTDKEIVNSLNQVTATEKEIRPSTVVSPVQANPRRLINNTAKKNPEKEQDRIVVCLGADSSDEELDEGSAPPPLPVKSDSFVKSKIDEFLMNARKQVEAQKTEPKLSTPKAVNDHLPLSQRLEYRRLKKTLHEKELESKANMLKTSLKPTASKQPQALAKAKETRLLANKLLAILKSEEDLERNSKAELAQLQMQIRFVEQKMLAHAKNAARVRLRLKSLLLGNKKLAKPKVTPSPNTKCVKTDAPKNPASTITVPKDTKDFSSYESPLNQIECSINPLQELCPHDLAGECRDPHCKYQHTKAHAKVTSQPSSIG